MRTISVLRTILIKSIAIFILSIALYFILALSGGFIPVNTDFTEDPEGITVYVLSNGVHTDLVLPVKSEVKDWAGFFSEENFHGHIVHASFIAFGWGDRQFYIHTPEWKDLKFSIAVGALFPPGETAMHVTLFDRLDEDDLCIRLKISPEQFKLLTSYVYSTFQLSEKMTPIKIGHQGYGETDLFFAAKGSFHLFKSCNTWTNYGLLKAGIRCPLWTPFDRPILYQIRRNISEIK